MVSGMSTASKNRLLSVKVLRKGLTVQVTSHSTDAFPIGLIL